MLIWTDMAPTCSKVTAMAVAARKGMSMGESFWGWWVEGQRESALTVRSRALGGGIRFRCGVFRYMAN